jgi:hypothetical protein
MVGLMRSAYGRFLGFSARSELISKGGNGSMAVHPG